MEVDQYLGASFFLDLNADSHGVKTHQKASFETKNGQISSTPKLPWQVFDLKIH